MTLSDIYKRLGTAYSKGRGMRLSADDVATLIQMDDAVQTTVLDVCKAHNYHELRSRSRENTDD